MTPAAPRTVRSFTGVEGGGWGGGWRGVELWRGEPDVVTEGSACRSVKILVGTVRRGSFGTRMCAYLEKAIAQWWVLCQGHGAVFPCLKVWGGGSWATLVAVSPHSGRCTSGED